MGFICIYFSLITFIPYNSFFPYNLVISFIPYNLVYNIGIIPNTLCLAQNNRTGVAEPECGFRTGLATVFGHQQKSKDYNRLRFRGCYSLLHHQSPSVIENRALVLE